MMGGTLGNLGRTFRMGDAAVSDLLVVDGRLKAAYCGGRLTCLSVAP
jgi:hypothetical protein